VIGHSTRTRTGSTDPKRLKCRGACAISLLLAKRRQCGSHCKARSASQRGITEFEGKIAMEVMDVIVEILKREGVTKLFCFPTTPIIEAAVAAGITPVICRQERVGVDMANGYAKVKNGEQVGVFAMQYGPGSENAFPGIATAWSDATPLLLLPLSHSRATSQVFPMFRSSRTYASVTKSAEEIMLPEEVCNVMRRAFSHLKSGRRGPVMVEVPMDVVRHELGEFPIGYRPVRETRSRPDPRDVDDAVRILLEARCPIVQAGQGVLCGRASAELVELCELLELPVMTTVDGKSAFPETHPLSIGTAGAVMTGDCRTILAESDLVLGIGTSLTRHHLVNPILPDGKRVIHATNDPFEFYKAYDTEVALLGDVKLTLRDLIEAAKDRIGSRPRDHTIWWKIRTLRKEWMAQWLPKLQSDETPMTPYRVIWEFMRVVNPNDAIVTHDSGSPRDQMLPFYMAAEPRSYLGWGKSHQLGTGLGLTIGAKHAAPEKLCVNFMGDAAFGMTGLDFETAVRSDAPILTIVLNNSTMAIETRSMKLSQEKHRARDLGGNYAGLARDLGGWSERVSDPGKIGEAILRARQQTENGKAALLEFITSAETEFSFRTGMQH